MNDEELETARKRAYGIWEEEGQPEGRHESHWYRALRELGLVPVVDPEAGAIRAGTRTKLEHRK